MIPDIEPVNTWAGNGVNTIFDFDFLINSENELSVFKTDNKGIQTALKLNVDYTITQIGNKDGGNITFPILGSNYVVLKEDEKITLMLKIPVAQTSPYGTSKKLNLKSLEYSLDYIVRLIQMVNRVAQRAVKVQEGSTTTPDELMESLNQAQVNAQNFANIASNKADIAIQASNTALNQASIATSKTLEVTETYNNAMADIQADRQAALDDIDDKKNNVQDLISKFNVDVTSSTAVFTEMVNDSSLNISNQVNEGIESLNNSSNALTRSQTTNCILEVPQRIKLELLDGVITLKAGSELVYPDGFETDGVTPKFKYVKETEETIKTANTSTNTAQQYLWRYPKGSIIGDSGIGSSTLGYMYVSNGHPASVAYSNVANWNLSTNKIEWTADTGKTWTTVDDCSLPFAIVTNTNGVFTSIDTVFETAGYLGNTAWVHKGVKGLIPNNRNTDGTLNNIEYTTSDFTFMTISAATTRVNARLYVNTANQAYLSTILVYDEIANLNKIEGEPSQVFSCAEFDVTNGKISNFVPYNAFQAVDYKDLMQMFSSNGLYSTVYISGKSGFVEYYTDSAKTKRAYIMQWITSNLGAWASHEVKTFTWLKPFRNGNSYVAEGSAAYIRSDGNGSYRGGIGVYATAANTVQCIQAITSTGPVAGQNFVRLFAIGI